MSLSNNNNNNNNNGAGSSSSSNDDADFQNLKTPISPSKTTARLNPPSLQNTALNPLLKSPTTPRRKTTIYSDRFIPNRTGIDLQAAFNLSNDEVFNLRKRNSGIGNDNLLNLDNNSINNNINNHNNNNNNINNINNNGNGNGNGNNNNQINENEIDYQREEEANRTFNTVLKAELFGDNVPLATANLKNSSGINNLNLTRPSSSTSNSTSSSSHHHNHARTPPRSTTASINSNSNFNGNGNGGNFGNDNKMATTPRQNANLFTYQSPSKSRPNSSSLDIQNDLYSLSPVRRDSQRLLLSPQKKPRSISKVPYRVLDAPDLADDFYLNLVDWGSTDILGVGLGSCVYLWNASSGVVEKLCDLGENDSVTSISWIGSGSHVAVGTNTGLVEIWDAASCKRTRAMTGHSSRVSSASWNEHILSSGSRDRSILHRDVREPQHFMTRLEAHKQEVCGLKWNVEENKLASGGNDNKLYVWEGLNDKPLYKFNDHNAAVKAISWSPHARGILASGGGTQDRHIKIWNTISGTKLNDIDTGSQVCNLAWSKNSNELVSTHGYSKNQIVVWKYPSMQQVASLTGHTYRVLYLAMSPDGQTIVTGAGDETLRFWNVFEKNKSDNGPPSVLLDAFMQL
ncbi:hypothetical protein PACTADRAFT_47910, partial [Pachysolen tannophilus NRRL Y-2460]